MIPKSVRQHLIKHVGKYLLSAAGLGTIAGPVVVPPIVDAGKEVFTGPPTSELDERYVTRGEYADLQNELRKSGLIPPPTVSISEVSTPESFTCPAHMIDDSIKQYCTQN